VVSKISGLKSENSDISVMINSYDNTHSFMLEDTRSLPI
jgi:hypothetical protein